VIFCVLATAGLEMAKNARPLSPPSRAPRRIGAVADEERSRPKSDRSRREIKALYLVFLRPLRYGRNAASFCIERHL